MSGKPQFPLKVSFSDDNEVQVFENADELACTLEWFDSDDDEYHAKVCDALGREVHVIVRKLEIAKLELK